MIFHTNKNKDKTNIPKGSHRIVSRFAIFPVKLGFIYKSYSYSPGATKTWIWFQKYFVHQEWVDFYADGKHIKYWRGYYRSIENK
jgi:hypothetical protein